MEKGTFVHVSFDLVDQFELRVPSNRTIGAHEEDVTPRICVSTDIRHALLSVPKAGATAKFMQDTDGGMPILIHAYYLSGGQVYVPTREEVPDVEDTNERWLVSLPAKVTRVDYELVDPVIIKMPCMDGEGRNFYEYFIVHTDLKRVRFQDNMENLVRLLSDKVIDKEYLTATYMKYPFKDVVACVGEHLIKKIKENL